LLADPADETVTPEDPVAKVETAMVVIDVTGVTTFHTGLLVIKEVTMVIPVEAGAMEAEVVELLEPTEEEGGNTTIGGDDKEAIRNVCKMKKSARLFL